MTTENKKFDWGKFDKEVDTEALAADVQDVEENGSGDFAELPEGTYEVEVVSMELGQSKASDPMLKITFEILDGEHEGNKIWYNGVMQPQNEKAFGFQTHRNNEMLRKIWDCEDKDDVKFTSFKDYAELVLDIHEEIDGKFEYLLKKSIDKKGYDQLEIVEVFEVE